MHSSPTLLIEDFFSERIPIPLVDVRSPVEFKEGHIPGAINIPLFDDHERETIGIIYKQRGKEEAVMKGLEIVSPKLAEFIRETKENSPTKKVIVYCFRGGMRSNSFSWLMNTAGLNSKIIEGGYKQYRRFILKQFEKKRNLILLGGPTGGGKTEIIKLLKKKGEQVIDLEALANHRGSAFGFIHMEAQPSQQFFENKLGEELLKTNENKPLWLEDESFMIGSCRIPFPLWLQMKECPIISLKVAFEKRVERLLKDYGTADAGSLEKAILGIRQKLGGSNLKIALEALKSGNLKKIAEMALHYYDEAYEYNHAKRKYKNIYALVSETEKAFDNANLIMNFYNSHFHEH